MCLVADRPDLIRSVVLLGGIGDIVRDPEVVARMRMWFRADASDAECLEVMRWEVADPATAASVLQRVTRCPASAAALVTADRATAREEWASFKGEVPVLVVQGLADRLAPRIDEPALRELFGSNVRLVNVPRAGHMLVVEQPASVAAAVLSFLRSP